MSAPAYNLTVCRWNEAFSTRAQLQFLQHEKRHLAAVPKQHDTIQFNLI